MYFGLKRLNYECFFFVGSIETAFITILRIMERVESVCLVFGGLSVCFVDEDAIISFKFQLMLWEDGQII